VLSNFHKEYFDGMWRASIARVDTLYTHRCVVCRVCRVCWFTPYVWVGVYKRYKDEEVCFAKFDGMTISSHVHCIKPQPEIYQHLLQGTSVGLFDHQATLRRKEKLTRLLRRVQIISCWPKKHSSLTTQRRTSPPRRRWASMPSCARTMLPSYKRCNDSAPFDVMRLNGIYLGTITLSAYHT
jgi:hypothetical protein